MCFVFFSIRQPIVQHVCLVCVCLMWALQRARFCTCRVYYVMALHFMIWSFTALLTSAPRWKSPTRNLPMELMLVLSWICRWNREFRNSKTFWMLRARLVIKSEARCSLDDLNYFYASSTVTGKTLSALGIIAIWTVHAEVGDTLNWSSLRWHCTLKWSWVADLLSQRFHAGWSAQRLLGGSCDSLS